MKIESKRLESLNYLACYPESFSANKTYPIIIHFHGAGARGNDVKILKNQSIVQYAEQTAVYPEESQKMVDAVNHYGGNAKLTLYEGVKHNSWEQTYSNPEIYKWLLS